MDDYKNQKRFYKGGLIHSFSWFHSTQYYLGSSRIVSQNGTLVRPSFYHKIYTIVMGLSVLFGYIGIDRVYLPKYRQYDSNMYICTVLLIIIHYLAYAFNLFQVRFMNADDNIQFYFKLEDIDRLMKVDKIKVLYDFHRKINNINVCVILFVFFSLSFMTCLDGSVGVALTGIVATFSEIVFVMEITKCSSLQFFFSNRLRLINAIIANHLKCDKNKKRSTRQLVAKSHNFHTSDTDEYLRELIAGFADFQRFSRFQIFVFCFKCVVGTFFYFQTGLIGLRIKVLGYLEYMTFVTFVMYSTSVLLIICISSEMFFNDALETKQLCTSVLSIYLDGPLRDKAARMLKTLESCPLRLSIYDMWDMDARLVLTIFFVTTMMMVTQLQFTFL